MPVNAPLARAIARCLALGALAPAVAAQTLPHRERVDAAVAGGVGRDLAGGARPLVVAPDRPVLAELDGGRWLELRATGSPPDVWTSQSGALLQRATPSGADGPRTLVDSLGRGPRWLALESTAPTEAEVHVRVDGRVGGADPWLVPLQPEGGSSPRTRPGYRDHVRRLDDAPVAYAVEGQRTLRLDVWRSQRPRLAPADATWVRVEADGTRLFEGRLPTPVARERLHVTEGCADVLDLAGRLRIELPAGIRQLRVRGEAGTWLKVLAPLPGTPTEVLAVEADPAREQLLPRADEPIESAFARAVAAFPDAHAQAFLARYSYLRPVALRPEGGGVVRTRLWRPRFPDRDDRGTPVTRAPAGGEAGVAPVAFHWLPAGARWRLATTGSGGAGLLRIAVAHADASAPEVRLRLQQQGARTLPLRLDPRIVQALDTASSEADALLAVDPRGAAIVDASQVVLRRADMETPAELVNTGRVGAWIAVEQRVPAPRALAEAALAMPTMPVERLQDALLATGAGSDEVSDPATTRAVDAARRLVAARAMRFSEDACVVAMGDRAQASTRALSALDSAGGVDPLLARCAALQAIAAAPADPTVQAAFDAWAAAAGQAELRSGAWARAVQSRPREASAWAHLAAALAAEGEHGAAALAARAAGQAPAQEGETTASQPARQAAAFARLRSDREAELAYAVAGAASPAAWTFDRAGPHVLELRATADAPQWVRLRSGTASAWALLPAADPAATTLRDAATASAPGLAVRVAFDVAVPGQSLSVESAQGDVLARVEGPQPGALAATPSGHAFAMRDVVVGARVAADCRIHPLEARLPVLVPGAPLDALPTDGVGVVFAPDAPLAFADIAPRTAPQAALQALRLVEAGRTDAAQALAARAHALRERDAAAPAPGVFAELDRHVTWRRLRPEAHAGLLTREVADGRSGLPLLARRERWAGIEDDGAFVLRPGQGWVVEGLRPGEPVRLALQVRSVLADRVALRTTRGESRVLRDGGRVLLDDTADSGGALRLRVDEALPGTFVLLDVIGRDGAPLEARRRVAYHRGPVTVRVSGPTLLRIVEWDGRGTEVRTQHVDAAGPVRIAARRAGAALRISALELQPAPHRVAPATPPPASGEPASRQPARAEASAPHAPPVPSFDAPFPDAVRGTWGLQFGWQQRIDPDDGSDRRERFGELRARWRWSDPGHGLRGRLDAIGRRHEADFGVLGLQHLLQWRQPDGSWGATLDASAWRQSAPAAPDGVAHALQLRAALDWSRRRGERWRDEWELGLRWRALSLRDVAPDDLAGVDNDVYSRYRDRHRRQLDVGYRVAWRARYATEWVFEAQAASNDLARLDGGALDQVGAGLAWRWARHGWTASAGVDLRRYLRDDDRRSASTRERLELSLGRLWLSAGDGWRLRLATGVDGGRRDVHAGLFVEWFDHDGRGLDDFAPSELFLRAVTETDLVAPMLPPEAAP